MSVNQNSTNHHVPILSNLFPNFPLTKLRLWAFAWKMSANRGVAKIAGADIPRNSDLKPSLATICRKQSNALRYCNTPLPHVCVCKSTLIVSRGYPTTSDEIPPKLPAKMFQNGSDLVRYRIFQVLFNRISFSLDRLWLSIL